MPLLNPRERSSCDPKPAQEGIIPCEWHRSYHCSWTKGLPSHQMRVCAFLGPDGGTATSHRCSSGLPHCPTEERRQGRDLALLLHHHMPRRIPDDRYGPVADYVLPGGVTVTLLYFWPIINSQSNQCKEVFLWILAIFLVPNSACLMQQDNVKSNSLEVNNTPFSLKWHLLPSPLTTFLAKWMYILHERLTENH